MKRVTKQNNSKDEKVIDEFVPFEYPKEVRLITTNSAISTLALLQLVWHFADFITNLTKGSAFELPTFVWALAGGVILRNSLENILKLRFLIELLMYLEMHHYLYILQWLYYL